MQPPTTWPASPALTFAVMVVILHKIFVLITAQDTSAMHYSHKAQPFVSSSHAAKPVAVSVVG